MSRTGHTTRLPERVEIGERWEAGQTDAQIAQALQRPIATVRKWRRRYQRLGRAGLTSQMGRPKTGALGQFSTELIAAIAQLRNSHPGWGPITVRIDIQKDPHFLGQPVPSRARIAAYFREQHLAKPYERHQDLPQPKRQIVSRPHQCWEVDAQGELQVVGLGGVSILNIQDVFSHWKVGSLACLHTSHPSTQDHQLLFRRAFVLYGLPEAVSLDHDSVYIDNQTASPFPTRLHLWLIALGIQVRFIQQPPPYEHAHIERGHQTVTQQAVCGQSFQQPSDLHASLAERLDFLNREYPSRALQGQSPLSAYPQAQQPQRPYRLEWEPELLDLHRVYDYLAQGRWFRLTSRVGMFSLGKQRYSAKSRFARQTLEITYDPLTGEFCCLPEKGDDLFRLAAKGLRKEVLMGELDPLLSIPNYQLALPFSRETWRQSQLCQQLSGTTL